MAQPPTLNKVFDPKDEDQRTYSQVIVGMIRSGLSIKAASEMVGIDHAQIDGWRRDGAKINRSGKPEPGRRTVGQQAMVEFALGIARARTLYMATLVEALTSLARGGIVTKHTKSVEVVDNTGAVLSRRTEETERTLAPNSGALRFLLATRFPDEFNPTRRLELTGADGGPLAIAEDGSVVEGLLADLERLSERHAAAQIALSNHGVDPDGPAIGVASDPGGTTVHTPDDVTDGHPSDV